MRTKVIGGMLALMLVCTAVAAQSAATSAPAAPTTVNSDPLIEMRTLKAGAAAPDFKLIDTQGNTHELHSLTAAGNTVVLEWFNPHCPDVAKYHANPNFMNDTAADFTGRKVVWLSIDSNGPGANGASDSAAIEAFSRDHALNNPVLLDRDGAVGRAYGVDATPTIYVITASNTVAYIGAPDESTALDREPSGTNYLEAAVSASLQGDLPAMKETMAHGCAVDYAIPSAVAAAPSLLPTSLPPARPMAPPQASH